jgi:hypothetical protein
MSAVLDLMIRRNPLLAHGPRTHSTGIQLAERAAAPRAPRRPMDVDAPRIHLGPAGRR